MAHGHKIKKSFFYGKSSRKKFFILVASAKKNLIKDEPTHTRHYYSTYFFLFDGEKRLYPEALSTKKGQSVRDFFLFF